MAQQHKITICGPKADGTYLIEFRTAEGGDLNSAKRGGGDQTFPGTDVKGGVNKSKGHSGAWPSKVASCTVLLQATSQYRQTPLR